MIIKFKDGHRIRFLRYGDIWLAESVIWEDTVLHASLEELRALKARITKWFGDNAPERIRDRFTVRLPLWNEIEYLPFKDQIAYKEGKISQITEYLLGDEYRASPLVCNLNSVYCPYSWYCRDAYLEWAGPIAIRLCLEERG